MQYLVEKYAAVLKGTLVLLSVLRIGVSRFLGWVKEFVPFKLELPPEPPQLYGEELPAEIATIVYIIDCSCSMDSQWQTFFDENGNNASGYRMDRAKSEVITSIRKLDENINFDVIEFTCRWSTCFMGPQEATRDNKETAIAFVRGFKLDPKGATATGSCVAWALKNYPDATFILVTDGDPNVLESGSGRVEWRTHLEMIRDANSSEATIHVLAVSPTSKEMNHFNESVAAENGPGRVVVVGGDARVEPQPTEGLDK